jgi:hypothetical protein
LRQSASILKTTRRQKTTRVSEVRLVAERKDKRKKNGTGTFTEGQGPLEAATASAFGLRLQDGHFILFYFF